ncbi:MAG: magnesium transporter [Bacteroidota bacterium]|nr:magnesium transporter [Bacteroidota bacterium]
MTRQFLNELKDFIESKDEQNVRKLILDLHPADIAEIYDELNIEEAKFLFILLDKDIAADVLVELEDDARERFLDALSSKVIAKFIKEMETDDATDIIGELSEEKQEEILSHIDDIEHVGDIADLLTYDEDTAGGLMGKELVAVQEEWDIENTVQEIRRQAKEIDEIYFVYVVNKDNYLQGIISLKELLLGAAKDKIKGLIEPDIISVRTDTDAEDVAVIMDKYDLVAIPVVDNIGRLLGRITIDDVVDVMREEAGKDYQLVSGITSDVESSDKVIQLTRARLPWLLIGLLGGILGAQVISHYESDLNIYPEMAFFIPLIAAMGGNVGIQSSSIIVQSLANKTLGVESTLRKLTKEFSVGLMNGIICSVILFVYNYFMSDVFALTISVSISLFTVILFASVFGTLIPLTLNRFKIDPALATGPFITTVNDVLGLFIYLIIGRYMYMLYNVAGL